MNLRSRSTAVLLTLSTLGACGGSDGGAAGARGSQAQDTAIRSLPREPLSDADLMGLDRANIAMELPWTSNRVARDPGAAPRGTISGITTESHDGFDRVIVAFEPSSIMTGYDVSLVAAGSEVSCGDGSRAVELMGERMLVVRTMPSRAAAEDGRRNVRVATSATGAARFGEAGLACDDGNTTVWVAGLSDGAEVRVLELRAPARLVVDLR